MSFEKLRLYTFAFFLFLTLMTDPLEIFALGPPENMPIQVPLPNLNSRVNDESPSLSGDGQFLAFVSDRKGGRGKTDIYLYDIINQQLVDVSSINSSKGEQHPSLSHDGQLIAFESDRDGGEGGTDIYIYKLQKKQFFPGITIKEVSVSGLNCKENDVFPLLSGDGNFVAFGSACNGNGVYLYDLNQKSRQPLPDVGGRYTSLSHDGTEIAFSTPWQEGKGMSLCVYNIPEKTISQVLQSGEIFVGFPSLSGNGLYIAYSGGKGLFEFDTIFLLDISSGLTIPLKELNSRNLGLYPPSLNHDASLIAFDSMRGGGKGGSDIYLYKIK